MPYTLPRLEDLFTSVDPNDGPALASRLALCKAAVADSEARTQRGEFTYLPGRMHADHPETPTMLLDRLTKSVDPDTLAGVAGQLEQLKASMADLGKDLTLTSPLSTGLIPYDLEAPAKLLTPRPTPLRNRLPRLPGQGTTRELRRRQEERQLQAAGPVRHGHLVGAVRRAGVPGPPAALSPGVAEREHAGGG